MKRALFLLFILLFFCAVPVSAKLVSKIAETLCKNCTSDWCKIGRINHYVDDLIKYEHFNSFGVKSPELTLLTRTGDCSEISLLKTAILNAAGIDAKVIHGIIPKIGLHDAVEVIVPGFKPYVLNPVDGFIKHGNGLYPREYVIGE